MRKAGLSAFALTLLCWPLLAQQAEEKRPPKPLVSYRLELAIHETENEKRINTRRYSAVLEEDGRCRIRASSRVPISSEGKIMYMDVGLSIDCDNFHERDGFVSVSLSFEISTFERPEEQQKPVVGTPPLVRTIRAQSSSLIPAGKPTIVSRVDDMTTTRRYELEVTAVKIK